MVLEQVQLALVKHLLALLVLLVKHATQQPMIVTRLLATLLLLVQRLESPVVLGALLADHQAVAELALALKHAAMASVQQLLHSHVQEAAQELDKHAILRAIHAPALLDTQHRPMAGVLSSPPALPIGLVTSKQF